MFVTCGKIIRLGERLYYILTDRTVGSARPLSTLKRDRARPAIARRMAIGIYEGGATAGSLASDQLRYEPAGRSEVFAWRPQVIRLRRERPGRDRNRGSRLLGTAGVILALPSLSAPVEGPGFPVEHLRATDHSTSFEYRLTIARGQALLVDVDQRGLDFVLTVVSPNGIEQSFNSPLKRDGHETVLIESPPGGSYQLTLVLDSATDARATPVVQARTVSSDDPRIDAWRASTEGARLYAEGAQPEVSIAAFLDAADSWRNLGNARELAHAEFAVAMIEYWHRYDSHAAASRAANAAKRYLQEDDGRLYANALYLQALALIGMANEMPAEDAAAEFQNALNLLEQSHRTHESLANHFDQGRITNIRGLIHFNHGDLDEARRYWHQAIDIFAAMGEWLEELQVRQNLAVIDIDRGYGSRAIDQLTHIVDRIPADAEPEFRAVVLDNLGAAQRLHGDIDAALRAYNDSLRIRGESCRTGICDEMGRAQSLRGIGTAYYLVGELELATQHLEQALVIAETVNDGWTQEGILTTLGDIAYLQQKYSVALERHRRALATTSSEAARANRLVLVARDLNALARHRKAIQTAQDARSIAERVQVIYTRANALRELGRSHLGLGDLDEATMLFESALATYESLGLAADRADGLHNLAQAARARGDLEGAQQHSAASLAIVDGLRQEVAAPSLRAFFAGARRRYYEAHIDLLMELHDRAGSSDDRYLRSAVTVSERARARMLTDLLNQASVDLDRKTDPALAKRRQALLDELGALRHQRDRLLEQATDSSGSSSLQPLIDDMSGIEHELNVIETELYRADSQHTKTDAAQTLTADAIQKSLGHDEALLQYLLGEQRSFVWVVTRDSIHAVELSDRRTIEAAARRAFGRLSAPERGPSARASLDLELRALSGYILEPVIGHLNREVLLIAADGALQYVPFPVLPAGSEGRPLIEQANVVGIPSLSVISAQRRRARSGVKKTVAIFADPVFEASDPRLHEPIGDHATADTRSLLTRSSIAATLSRLPAAAAEAEAISQLVPEGQRVVHSGLDATRSRVLDSDLSRFRIVHFATHGLIDARYPALSALALSQVNEHRQPVEGFLRLHDIYNLKLEADVVVLSACQTALGREVRGEGLIGLTQGFLYAGARSLVVSLWPVSDRATAELMVQFYERVLDDGAPPARALAEAQRSIAAQRRWNHPYYWGAFVLVGDW